MDNERSILERAGLASGLLSEEQIDRAWQVLVESLSTEDHSLEEITDEQLSAQMIALGYLNRWQAEQLRLGRTKFTLGAYRILDAIGHGGMGWVFKCEHSLLGRIEAIKVLPRKFSNPSTIASFLREIRAQACLNHPNLVHLTYADKEGDTYFLVTEYVTGTDLRKQVRHHGSLSMNSAAMIVSQAAEALAHAHQAGLIHRDVKPGNLLITPAGHTKLADLGLASFHDDQGSQPVRKSRHIVGTADYLAPEIIVSPEKLQTISDIYSLGCTLYYSVTGKVPFPGGDTADKLRRHLDQTPLAPQKLNREVSDDFAQVIAALMEKRPADRVSTAEEVVALLEPWSRPAEGVSGQVGDGLKAAHSQGFDFSHHSASADTLANDSDSSDTPPSHQDTPDFSALRYATLPEMVAAEEAIQIQITPEEERPARMSAALTFEKIMMALVGVALFTAGMALYLLLSE